MGELIHLPTLRADRARVRREHGLPATFFFDVSDPLSYLTAEHVERVLGHVEWAAVNGTALRDRAAGTASLRKRAETRARDLRLPLIWPEAFPAPAPRALRAAAYACELGAGAQFALAASRLAFCGGFDLEDPEVLTEAAAAARVSLEGCLEAAGEAWRDEELADAAHLLRDRGIRELPAVAIGGRWIGGDTALVAAAALGDAQGSAPQPKPRRADPRRAERLRVESRLNHESLAPVG